VHIEGWFTAGSKTITFRQADGARGAHAIGKYSWTLQGQKFSLTRAGFQQSLEKLDAKGSPPPPSFCADGRIAVEATYTAATDGLECAVAKQHCLTNDFSACPQLSPRPPSYCSDGDIVSGPPSFIPSADGKECQMPSVHCLSRTGEGCPALTPFPPDFCSNGTRLPSEGRFTSGAAGKECQLPSVHCVSKDAAACPKL